MPGLLRASTLALCRFCTVITRLVGRLAQPSRLLTSWSEDLVLLHEDRALLEEMGVEPPLLLKAGTALAAHERGPAALAAGLGVQGHGLLLPRDVRALLTLKDLAL